ncbi:MAG TPA: VWA domain-containing protein [Bacteroidia bacterium]|nr:VWA domain-containing protein [Bacteroidia bacterium]
MTFAHPGLLWLLLVIPLLVTFYVFRHNDSVADILLPSPWNPEVFTPKPSYKQYLRHVVFGFRMLVIGLLIVIIARPQSTMSWKNITSEGIDIVIALDISGSMLSKDFNPSRIEAAKSIASKFIDNRPADKIGLVIFSSEAFTQCPLTTEHAIIKNLFQQVHTGMIADGTAIGDGLATAVARIKDDAVKSKVIILLTDGVNNTGSVAPLTAAEIAKVFNIRVYTIGIGTKGKAMTPDGIMPDGTYHYSLQDVQIDEDLLGQIAQMTGGKYFRATDNESMKKIYAEIDKMEKSRIEERDYTDREEKFLPFAIAACLLLACELLLRNTILKTVP